jgi:hypothetical protein
MAQRYSQQRTNYHAAEPVPDSAHPVVVASPRAIVRGADGSMTWVARCPRCSDHNDETLVIGTAGSARAPCETCGAIVEVRDSGIYCAAATVPPPKE